jgi:ribonuclease PH
MRENGRLFNELRQIEIEPNCNKFADGSCFIKIGNTHVICTANISETVPRFLRNTGSGWVTAEYSMLPGATHTRTQREVGKCKTSGRTHEIQRLIGRSLRSIVDLSAIRQKQVIVDCDVIQADGGTRTASITGGYISLHLALRKLYEKNVISTFPIKEQIAAISCGIINGKELLDLDYSEDSIAAVDANFVLTKGERVVEIQSTAEQKSFSYGDFLNMYYLANQGVQELIKQQNKVLGKL